MAFTDEVIERTNNLEKLLIDRGGVGRGLQERATSLRDDFDTATLSRIRSIAAVRDRLMHDPEYEYEGSEREFLETCDDTIRQLNRRVTSNAATAPTLPPPPPPRKSPLRDPAQPLGPAALKHAKRRTWELRRVPAAVWVLLTLLLLAAGGWWYHRSNPDFFRRLLARKVEMPRTMTVDEAQREALKRYPELGVNGSKLNTAYIARYKAYQQTRPEFFQNPQWPLVLADEVARK